jgi:hypothetical protein
LFPLLLAFWLLLLDEPDEPLFLELPLLLLELPLPEFDVLAPLFWLVELLPDAIVALILWLPVVD